LQNGVVNGRPIRRLNSPTLAATIQKQKRDPEGNFTNINLGLMDNSVKLQEASYPKKDGNAVQKRAQNFFTNTTRKAQVASHKNSNPEKSGGKPPGAFFQNGNTRTKDRSPRLFLD
jgi:hypothetical protein